MSDRIRQPQAATSLEYSTKLDRGRGPWPEGRWVLNLYPDAAEASGVFESAVGPGGDGAWLADLDRSAAEAARRARGKVRRYCAANRLNRLGTLTYRPPFCREGEVVRGHVRAFFRRLRKRTGPLAYLWVAELHADGERYHVHFAVGRFVRVGEHERCREIATKSAEAISVSRA